MEQKERLEIRHEKGGMRHFEATGEYAHNLFIKSTQLKKYWKRKIPASGIYIGPLSTNKKVVFHLEFNQGQIKVTDVNGNVVDYELTTMMVD
tara:strand:+ start:881 stop:1156 length:276 start_codon:yes stop_codon:yes gene_type:complete